MKYAIIVDPDNDTCEGLKTVMAESGWWVDCVGSIPTARDLLLTRKYTLVILDHYLAKYSHGRDLLSIRSIPVIVLSSLKASEWPVGPKVIQKPFSIETFLDALPDQQSYEGTTVSKSPGRTSTFEHY